jgi:hypothetical protein
MVRHQTRAIFTEVSQPEPTISPQEKLLIAGFIAAFLALFGLGLALTFAPLPIMILPCVLLAALAALVSRDLRHVIRYGWRSGPAGGEGFSGGGDDNPREPNPGLPPGDPVDPEWDRFVAQFWEWVEHERKLVNA